MHAEYTHDPLLAPLRRKLTRPQWQNLLALIVAVQLGRTFVLRQLAMYFAACIDTASCYRRLERVLGWEQERTWKPLSACWVRAVLRCFAPGRGRLVLLIDWTWHRDRCASLWVMVPVGGRAVPLCFWLAPPDMGGKGCQCVLEEQALRELQEWLPKGRRVVLVGDRGFYGAARIRFLRELGWHFVVRVTGTTMLRTRQGWTRLNDLAPAVGGRWERRRARLGRKETVEVNLVAVRQALLAPRPERDDQGKPTGGSRHTTTWFLATDLPLGEDVVTVYGWRMQIEETFRDYKALVRMEEARVKQPWERLHVLLWALMIGMARDLYQSPHRTEMPAIPRVKSTTEAPAHTVREYPSGSATREGLHTFFVALMEGTLPFAADLKALCEKSRRMKQRPQVLGRRKSSPPLRRRTRAVAST
jgi:hypothetical protein